MTCWTIAGRRQALLHMQVCSCQMALIGDGQLDMHAQFEFWYIPHVCHWFETSDDIFLSLNGCQKFAHTVELCHFHNVLSQHCNESNADEIAMFSQFYREFCIRRRRWLSGNRTGAQWQLIRCSSSALCAFISCNGDLHIVRIHG
jgi:hypothetical protein